MPRAMPKKREAPQKPISPTVKRSRKKKKNKSESSRQRNLFVLGIFLLFCSIMLLFSFISYVKGSGGYDQANFTELFSSEVKVSGVMGKLGAFFAMLFIYFGLGWASFIFPLIFFFTLGGNLILKAFAYNKQTVSTFLPQIFFHTLWMGLWMSLFFAQIDWEAGMIGQETFRVLSIYIGKWGVLLISLTSIVTYLIISLRLFAPIIFLTKKTLQTLKKILNWVYGISQDFLLSKHKKDFVQPEDTNYGRDSQTAIQYEEEATTISPEGDVVQFTKEVIDRYEDQISEIDSSEGDIKAELSEEKNDFEVVIPQTANPASKPSPSPETPITPIPNLDSIIQENIEEPTLVDVNKLFDDYDNDLIDHQEILRKLGEFNPKAKLPGYQYPNIELLTDHGEKIHYDGQELEGNRKKIVEVLGDYKVAVSKITATVGPTVTLYEIIPQKGVRVAQIKKLEDDIALSLSALGIRIIAPIPGRGTIGIEVPNKNPSLVSLRSVVQSEAFENTKMSLPCVLGKTIDAQPYIIDIAKLPHLLMAGATGQGKSVGLNVILASLLFKKHPAEVKFVMVDPKKVELSLFNLIERHFLAKLPDQEEAIITDTGKVVATLKSLCKEMDFRYDLLKSALVRNINEYNEKFCSRKLNPNKGHRFMPYIVLVVDEFADLMMTAGKEVEMPIARLAQLSRAVGIHLIIATQRPSVNVITGIIKANFPARIAFRVVSKVDSRTILDGSGADQLIGRGDFLFTQGSDIKRVQCAFIDTEEVERINAFIGNQRGFDTAFLLPEVEGSEGENQEKETDLKNLDIKFEEAAKVVVNLQQGSVSVLQRKMNVGHGRAGRLIDQLELAQIVGPHKGSKAREVLVEDEEELKIILDDIKKGR